MAHDANFTVGATVASHRLRERARRGEALATLQSSIQDRLAIGRVELAVERRPTLPVCRDQRNDSLG